MTAPWSPSASHLLLQRRLPGRPPHRLCRLLTVAALAVGTALAVPTTARAAGTALPSPGGGQPAATAPAARSTTKAPTCGTAEGFTRLAGGALYRLQDTQLLGAPNTLAETGVVGSSWGSFAWTGAGGDGVLYALTAAGSLLWFRYDATTSSWMPGSGATVGVGFTPGSKVVNIALGANGWLYTVRPD